MSLTPPELQYNNIWPKGFYSSFKEVILEPASGSAYWPGENVRVLIQSMTASSGVMDPYRSHIEIEVEIDQQYLPVGLLQVDSSAQSFIENLVINSKNREIERIPEYSVLAAWLTDIGISELYAEGRETEGLGYTNVDSIPMTSKQNNNYMQSAKGGIDSVDNEPTLVLSSGSGTVFPTQNSNAFLSRNGPYSMNTNTNPVNSKTLISKNIKGHINTSNLAWFSSDKETSWEIANYPDSRRTPINQTAAQTSIKALGYVKNLRAEYVESIQSLNYPDSTTSRPSYEINLDPTVFDSGSVNQEWNNGPYKTIIPDKINYQIPTWTNKVNGATSYYRQQIANTTSLQGFSSLYSPNFCKGIREPFISATVPQCQMANGKILPFKIPIVKKVFKIPLISAVIGLLIPEDQFVLLPLQALNDLSIEFTIDKYAMFTSGYNDTSEYDDAGMKMQQARAFQIKRIEYKMHTYTFRDPNIEAYLVNSLNSRILINSHMWTLGNQYQIARGDNVQNNYLVSCTAEALNEVVALFVPNDYQKYSFCRKHFRLSNNVTKFQMRTGEYYWPPQPLIGNGGNPQTIDGLDNGVFLQQIYWSNNFMFNKINPIPRINAYNFAINERCYDPTRKTTFYSENVYAQESSHIWTPDSVNQDTALGMPWIHENRFVGKAGYVYSFEPYAHSAYHLTGLDCRQLHNIQLMFTTHPQDYFPREQTLYIFTRCSTIVEYTMGGINVYGR